ncbi:unnamed protein product, partial [Laminaria digitata]
NVAGIARAQRTALGDVDVTLEREAAYASGTGASKPVLDEAATGKAGVSGAESIEEDAWELFSLPYVERKITYMNDVMGECHHLQISGALDVLQLVARGRQIGSVVEEIGSSPDGAEAGRDEEQEKTR